MQPGEIKTWLISLNYVGVLINRLANFAVSTERLNNSERILTKIY